MENSKIFHFGSVSMTEEPSRSAMLEAVSAAKKAGLLLSYDPNYRAALWKQESDAVFWMRRLLQGVDILKLSDEETALLTGVADPEEAAAYLSAQGIPLVLVTLGGNGVYYRLGSIGGYVPGCNVHAVDTNGAGDTFLGAVLSCILQRKTLLHDLTEAELIPILQYANQAAALTVSRYGAIPAMPNRAEVLAHLKGDHHE